MNHKERLEVLGSVIRTIRKEKGLSQKELAVLSDVDLKTITKTELGQTNPTINSLFALADALGVEPKSFFI